MMADVFTCSLLLIGRLFYILQEAPFSVCWWLYIMGVWLAWLLIFGHSMIALIFSACLIGMIGAVVCLIGMLVELVSVGCSA